MAGSSFYVPLSHCLPLSLLFRTTLGSPLSTTQLRRKIKAVRQPRQQRQYRGPSNLVHSSGTPSETVEMRRIMEFFIKGPLFGIRGKFNNLSNVGLQFGGAIRAPRGKCLIWTRRSPKVFFGPITLWILWSSMPR